MGTKGWVYVATNESMPGIVKIGRSKNHPDQRMSELQSTGVPTPFLCNYCVLVEHHEDLEAEIHRAFSEVRVTENREFFRLRIDQAIQQIKSVSQPLYEEGSDNHIQAAARSNAQIKAKKERELRESEANKLQKKRSDALKLVKSDMSFFADREKDFLHFASRVEKVRRSSGMKLGFGFPGLKDNTRLWNEPRTPSGAACETGTDGKGYVYSEERHMLLRLWEVRKIGLYRYHNGSVELGSFIQTGGQSPQLIKDGPLLSLYKNGDWRLCHENRGETITDLYHWKSGPNKLKEYRANGSLDNDYGAVKLGDNFQEFINAIVKRVIF